MLIVYSCSGECSAQIFVLSLRFFFFSLHLSFLLFSLSLSHSLSLSLSLSSRSSKKFSSKSFLKPKFFFSFSFSFKVNLVNTHTCAISVVDVVPRERETHNRRCSRLSRRASIIMHLGLIETACACPLYVYTCA